MQHEVWKLRFMAEKIADNPDSTSIRTAMLEIEDELFRLAQRLLILQVQHLNHEREAKEITP